MINYMRERGHWHISSWEGDVWDGDVEETPIMPMNIHRLMRKKARCNWYRCMNQNIEISLSIFVIKILYIYYLSSIFSYSFEVMNLNLL